VAAVPQGLGALQAAAQLESLLQDKACFVDKLKTDSARMSGSLEPLTLPDCGRSHIGNTGELAKQDERMRSLTADKKALQDQVTAAAAGAALLEGDMEELQNKLRTVPLHFT
jgi:hypothetical protein